MGLGLGEGSLREDEEGGGDSEGTGASRGGGRARGEEDGVSGLSGEARSPSPCRELGLGPGKRVLRGLKAGPGSVVGAGGEDSEAAAANLGV